MIREAVDAVIILEVGFNCYVSKIERPRLCQFTQFVVAKIVLQYDPYNSSEDCSAY